MMVYSFYRFFKQIQVGVFVPTAEELAGMQSLNGDKWSIRLLMLFDAQKLLT